MMLSEGKRLGCQSVPQDTLSNLPDNVTDAILMHLPLRDAVRTSILSKNWRYIWSRLPQLTLDQTLWETTKDLISPAIKFTNIIYHLLTLHSGPITTFTLSIPALGNCPKLDNLIYFLSKNGIQDLFLQFPKGNPYELPSSFFTCLQMRHLLLENCLIHPPPAFRGFDRLVTLGLWQVTITSKLLESLITHSPLLEHLCLFSVILDHIQVNALNLRTINFVGNIKSISLKDVPLLEKLSLWEEPESSIDAGKGDISKFFESCPSVEDICLNHRIFKFLAAGAGKVLTRLPYDLNCLKRLCLHKFCLSQSDEVSCALCLIRSSPHLQTLEIQVCNGAAEKIPTLDSVEGFSDVTFNHLRTVKLEGIIGTKLEMQLIKLLLAKSPMLVRMQIEPGKGDSSQQTRLKVCAELTRFRRASTEAEVVYNVDSN